MNDEEEVTLDAPDASAGQVQGTVAQVHLGRWGKLSWFPFETLIGFLLIISGASYVLDPRGASGALKPPIVAIVTVGLLYIVAGSSMVLGLWRLWLRVELFGILLLEIGFVTWLLMGLLYGSTESLRQALVFFPLTWAATTRALSLIRGRTTIQFKRTEP